MVGVQDRGSLFTSQESGSKEKRGARVLISLSRTHISGSNFLQAGPTS